MQNNTFSDRTDSLANAWGVSLEEVAQRVGISRAMFFGYRTGRYDPSRKALAKLAKAEESSGFNVEYLREPEKFASPLKLAAAIARGCAEKLGCAQEVQNQIFAVAERVLTPALLPTASDVNRRQRVERLQDSIRQLKDLVQQMEDQANQS